MLFKDILLVNRLPDVSQRSAPSGGQEPVPAPACLQYVPKTPSACHSSCCQSSSQQTLGACTCCTIPTMLSQLPCRLVHWRVPMHRRGDRKRSQAADSKAGLSSRYKHLPNELSYGTSRLRRSSPASSFARANPSGIPDLS